MISQKLHVDEGEIQTLKLVAGGVSKYGIGGGPDRSKQLSSQADKYARPREGEKRE